MATITIQVNNNKALRLIQDLADLNLIRIVKDIAPTKGEGTLSKETNNVPLWQKKILDQRIATFEEDKKGSLDFDDAINNLSAELGL